ncbi:MAG: hypothetical protein LBF50_07380 [Azoarcus sp.]|jgi:hypothetical protein|nr:hypothetical protein [Azoarcus sp.]
MGPKSLAFVERAHEFAQNNAALRPAFLDMEEFDADFADAHNLWDIQNSIKEGAGEGRGCLSVPRRQEISVGCDSPPHLVIARSAATWQSSSFYTERSDAG